MLSKYVGDNRVIGAVVLKQYLTPVNFSHNCSCFMVTAATYYANKQIYDPITL